MSKKGNIKVRNGNPLILITSQDSFLKVQTGGRSSLLNDIHAICRMFTKMQIEIRTHALANVIVKLHKRNVPSTLSRGIGLCVGIK